MMCMFCVAIPMTASLGVAVTVKHREKQNQAKAAGHYRVKAYITPGKTTTVLVAALVVSAAVYHTIIAPQTGVFL